MRHAARTVGGLINRSVLVVAMMLTASCQKEPDDPLMEASQALEPSQVLKLARFRPDSERICILGPYEPGLEERDPDAERVYNFIRAHEIRIDEDIWHIVTLSPQRISLTTVSRSPSLDLLTKENRGLVEGAFPKKFNLQKCSSTENAAVTKFVVDGRTYFALGVEDAKF